MLFVNIIDQMAFERLLVEVNGRMHNVDHLERAGELLQLVVDAMEIEVEILRGR